MDVPLGAPQGLLENVLLEESQPVVLHSLCGGCGSVQLAQRLDTQVFLVQEAPARETIGIDLRVVVTHPDRYLRQRLPVREAASTPTASRYDTTFLPSTSLPLHKKFNVEIDQF